jgi:integrase/recombinase XerC/integrase/recombinase XerD
MARAKKTPKREPVNAPPWSDCVARFGAWQLTEERSAHTIRAYASDLDMFRDWFERTNGEPLTMEEIGTTLIGSWKGAMLDAGKSTSTINRRLATLGSFLTWALDERLIARAVKPAKGIKLEELGHRGLEPRDERALLRAVAENDRDRAVVHILLYSGMRVGELAALRWRDISLADRKGSITVVFGKGGKTRRLPVHALVRAALVTLGLDEHRKTDRHVVYGRRGPLQVRAIQSIVERYGVNAHALRHTFARKFLKENPGELEQLSRILGHESLDTTKRYAVSSEDDHQAAVDRIDPA